MSQTHRKEWISNLAPNDFIDLLIDQRELSGKNRFVWSRVMISDASNPNHIVVHQCGSNHITGRQYVNRKDFTISRPGKKAKDFEWRYQLKVGDLDDVLFPKTGIWCLSTVLAVYKQDQNTDNEVFNQFPIVQILVGLRYYHKDGDQTEIVEDGDKREIKRYFGLSQAID